MSSKTQYKDVIKRKDKTIRELNAEVVRLNKSINNLRRNNRELANALVQNKKWWQFWK